MKTIKIKPKPILWDVKSTQCIHKDHHSLPPCAKPAVQDKAHGWLCEEHLARVK